MIPPAFPEIRKPMSECKFEEFEAERADPSHIPVPHDEHLTEPPKEMSDKVHIEYSTHNISELRIRVFTL